MRGVGFSRRRSAARRPPSAMNILVCGGCVNGPPSSTAKYVWIAAQVEGRGCGWRFQGMAETKSVRIVLADDHALVLEGLRALLAAEPDLRVIATATDGERLLDAVRRFAPDVVAMDLQMPFMNGLTCLHHIRAENLPVRVLVISAFGDAQSLRAAVEGGADGFAL